MSAPSKPLFDDPKGPPGASPRVRKLARRVVGPIESFLAIEAASGIILLLAAAAALIWANSPWRDSYHHLWETPVALEVGTWSAKASLHFVVNDVLMAIFFLVVGLEIRREIHDGELSDLRRATLPIAAAIGGMLVPAGIYAAMNPSAPEASGWGVPMATDIAFAVGILALLGKRVPPALRVLLLALAIIDDIGAILVIAIFYSSGVEAQGFLIAGAGVAGILALQLLGVRLAPVYAIPAIALWAGILQAGVHPTIAGVISGLLTPATMWPGREDKAPVEYVQHALHPWVAYVIMPVFALANAGVDMSGVDLGASPMVAIGIALGLLLGKPIGVLLASALCVKLGIATMPRGVTWGGMVVVGTVAAIGFTMALFIAGLAFPSQPQLNEVAKLGILGASAIAAILTLVLGRVLLPERIDPAAAQTATEAESSTEA